MFGFDTGNSIIEVAGFSERGNVPTGNPADQPLLQMCELVGHAGERVLAPCTFSAPN